MPELHSSHLGELKIDVTASHRFAGTPHGRRMACTHTLKRREISV